MTEMAASTQSSDAAGMAVVFILVTGSVLIGFGYARSVMDRANMDYKKTKEALPAMRKVYWQSWWKATKFGGGVLIIVVLLVMTMMRH